MAVRAKGLARMGCRVPCGLWRRVTRARGKASAVRGRYVDQQVLRYQPRLLQVAGGVGDSRL